MTQKTFTIDQISKKINDLFDLLDTRTLKLGSGVSSLEKSYEAYDKMSDLDRKLGQMRGNFRHSAFDVIEQSQNDLLVKAMMTLPSDDVAKLTEELKEHRAKTSTTSSETSKPSYSNPV